MEKYTAKVIQGILTPFKVAPFAAENAVVSAGLLIPPAMGFQISGNNLEKILISSTFLIPSVCFLAASVKMAVNSYSAYFTGLKSLLEHKEVNPHYLERYCELNAYCKIVGYRAACYSLGYEKQYEEIRKSIRLRNSNKNQ